MSYLYVVAGDNTSVVLDDIANQLRKKISAGKLPLAKQSLPLPTQVGVVEVLLVVRGGEEQHVHASSDLIFSVLEGGGYVELATGETIEAPAGTTIVVPRGTSHAYNNTSPSDSVLLATLSPATP